MTDLSTPKPRPVVTAIIEKEEDGQRKIYLHTRWKPSVSPRYSGLLELPVGGIDGYENVYDAIAREVKEETGLELTRIIDDWRSEIDENQPGDTGHVFRPFLCHQVLKTTDGLPWLGFVFRCEAVGEVRVAEDEAKDPRWVTLSELEAILVTTPEKIFPLHFGVLNYYVKFCKQP